MTSTTDNTNRTTLTKVLAACVVLAGTRSLLAATAVDISASEASSLQDELDPGSPFEQLFADWDLDTSADRNCDGTVDINDYLDALATGTNSEILDVVLSWGRDTSSDLDCDGTVGIGDFLVMAGEMVQSEVDALIDDWGYDTSSDLNCDGVVDINDYLDALNYEDFQVFLDIIADWGTGSPHDLDCDGTVGMEDYLLLLGNAAQDAIGQAEP